MSSIHRIYVQRSREFQSRTSCDYEGYDTRHTYVSVLGSEETRDSDPEIEIPFPQEQLADLFDGPVPDVVLDLVELAAAVFRIDRHIERRPEQKPSVHDSDARIDTRTIRIRFPVLSEQFASGRVEDLLSTLLSFMMRDIIEIEMIRHEDSRFVPVSQEQPSPDRPDAVSLFSAGLDSAGGVYENRKEGIDSEYVTLSYGSGVPGVYDDTIDQLGLDPHKFSLTQRQERSNEYTSFSRGFLHWAFAIALAIGTDASEVRSFETGIMAHFLLVTEGWQTTRTVAPRAVMLFNELLSELFNRDLVLTNPFIDSTKREVIRRIEDEYIVRKAISCPHYSQQNKRGLANCGQCVPCIVRNLAILSSDFGIPPAELSTSDWAQIDFESRELPDTCPESLAGRNDAETFFLAIYEIAYLSRLLRQDTLHDLVTDYPKLASRGTYELYHRFSMEFFKAIENLSQPNPSAEALCR